MLLTCRATVFSVMSSWVAIARLVLAAAMSVRTSLFAPAQTARTRRPDQPSEALEIGCGAQFLGGAARRVELELRARTVTELAAGNPDQQPDTRPCARRSNDIPGSGCRPATLARR